MTLFRFKTNSLHGRNTRTSTQRHLISKYEKRGGLKYGVNNLRVDGPITDRFIPFCLMAAYGVMNVGVVA